MTQRERLAPYPVSLNLDGIRCLVVGGGAVAMRKVESLLASGARVTVVSPRVMPELEALSGALDTSRKIELIMREFRPEDLEGKFLVICATNNRAVNEAVARAAKERLMLVNVVDVPELCNFYVNALVRRGDLAISVSTGGASPALSKRIRGELEERYGEEYATFLDLMREYRNVIIKRIDDPGARQKVFQELVNSALETILRERGESAAREAFEDIIERAAGASPQKNRQP
jgi:precorrin-2 dehydrogenase/sirohydrochlorin ferrochelatase